MVDVTELGAMVVAHLASAESVQVFAETNVYDVAEEQLAV